MDKITTTAQIYEDGRMVVPKPARDALGIDGKQATLSVDVGVIDVDGEDADD